VGNFTRENAFPIAPLRAAATSRRSNSPLAAAPTVDKAASPPHSAIQKKNKNTKVFDEAGGSFMALSLKRDGIPK
jgi:hypothetical protein